MTSAVSSSGSLPCTPSSTANERGVAHRALGDREVAQVEDGADLRLRGEPLVGRVAGALHRAGDRDQVRTAARRLGHPPAAGVDQVRARARRPPRAGSGRRRRCSVVEQGEPGLEGLRDPRRDPAAAPAAVVAGRVDVLAGRRPGRPPPASAARPAWRGTGRRRPAGAAGPGSRRARRGSRWRRPRRRPRCSSAGPRRGGTPPRRPAPRPRSGAPVTTMQNSSPPIRAARLPGTSPLAWLTAWPTDGDQAVAGLVAERVVDLLEPVDVGEHDGDRGTRGPCRAPSRPRAGRRRRGGWPARSAGPGRPAARSARSGRPARRRRRRGSRPRRRTPGRPGRTAAGRRAGSRTARPRPGRRRRSGRRGSSPCRATASSAASASPSSPVAT